MGKTDAWYGDRFTFGVHYDMHVNLSDEHIGERISVEDLVANLEAMGCDWVQTDCKGHPGVTGWKSAVPDATVNPKIHRDMMVAWREATKILKLPLHCHYSGILDHAAGEKHPEWRVVRSPARKDAVDTHRMCPRSPYLEKLVIPQLIELIDRYGVDGFWVDGDLWGVEACYCGACKAAWREAGGVGEPPLDVDDARWPAWMKFHRDSFDAYVKRYADAVHAHKAGVKVCSNWIQTFGDPGEPTAPTDWISGDNTWVYGYDSSRCEARFIATRGKPWDLMLWNFYCTGGFAKLETQPWVVKPAEMLMQEAAVSLAFGGHVQVYEATQYVRDGRLIPWRSKRIGEVARFVKMRRAVCQHTETIPQIAVLHSEHHYRSLPSRNLHWGCDTDGVRGAVFSLLEKSFGVDVMDEWALIPKISSYPMVVIPEQANLSERMVECIKEYTAQGGRVLVSGTGCFDRFGASFFGAESLRVISSADAKESGFPMGKNHPCLRGGDEMGPVWSKAFRLLGCHGAEPIGFFHKSPMMDDDATPYPSAIVNRFGKGRVAYVPFDVFKYFKENRYPFVREFIGGAIRHLGADFRVRVEAPVSVDVVLRSRGKKRIVHFIHRGSGLPNLPNSGAIDHLMPVGPITVAMRLPARPKNVALAFEGKKLAWKYEEGRKGRDGLLLCQVPHVRLHEALVVQ